MTDVNISSVIELNNGVKIPIFAFGTFMLEKGKQTREALLHAFDVGYRHIDTASIYGNEVNVGEALNQTDIPRDEIFITKQPNHIIYDLFNIGSLIPPGSIISVAKNKAGVVAEIKDSRSSPSTGIVVEALKAIGASSRELIGFQTQVNVGRKPKKSYNRKLKKRVGKEQRRLFEF